MSDNQALDTFDGLEYEEIEQAVMETSRGRWFLTEFARRHKAADTAELLDAIRRLEDQIQTMSAHGSNSSITQPSDGLNGSAEFEKQPAADRDEDASQPEIADKLDRTAQLVRSLRSSHKLISKAAEKPLRPPLPLSNAKPRIASAGDPPGYIRSDDDIFADDKSVPSESEPSADKAPENADISVEMDSTSTVQGDTLNFADITMPDTEALSDSSDTPVNATPAEEDLSSPEPDALQASTDDDSPVSGRLDRNSPAVTHQTHKNGEPVETSAATDEGQPLQGSSAAPVETEAAPKPKKRIIVIRRPADHPGDIPLAEGDSETSTDSSPDIQS